MNSYKLRNEFTYINSMKLFKDVFSIGNNEAPPDYDLYIETSGTKIDEYIDMIDEWSD